MELSSESIVYILQNYKYYAILILLKWFINNHLLTKTIKVTL